VQTQPPQWDGRAASDAPHRNPAEGLVSQAEALSPGGGVTQTSAALTTTQCVVPNMLCAEPITCTEQHTFAPPEAHYQTV
jgi:hypothetical protein